MNLLERISELRSVVDQDALRVHTADDVEQFRLKHLTKKGTLSALFEEYRTVPPQEKAKIGKDLNALKVTLEERFESMKAGAAAASQTAGMHIDVTLPGRGEPVGHLHPITQTLQEITRIFSALGFALAEGSEIEDDYHNFEALNFPPDHPARDMQDTFHVDDPHGNVLLRTHTSPVQVRVMESQKPPIRIIAPGRVYRNEAVSARSYCLFHQVEGLVVDEGITFSELQGTLIGFAQRFFDSKAKARFRPSFFPFTEPSAEMDITCYLCGGKGCRLCKGTGWLEILGCGMVHPAVFRNVGIDPERYTGYAFGMGIDRIAMLRFGIDDIRVLFENDVRMLRQF